MKKICVIGQGYIGIPTSLILADVGFEVIGIENDTEKIGLLQKNILPFHEMELDILAEKVFKTKNYSVSSTMCTADVYIICVPTPYKEDHSCNFKYIEQAAQDISKHVKKGNLIILESTVPPLTCEKVLIPIIERSGLKAKIDFYIAHAPERLIPGNMIFEIVHNDRIIGGIDEKSTKEAELIYSTFCKGKLLLTDAKTAEMCKLMENTYRDVNIALANEFALICEKIGINTYEAIQIANHHPRVNIHIPGPGVGGHCIPKDPWYIYQMAPTIAKLIYTSRITNNQRPSQIFEEILKILKNVQNPVVTIFGVAYKPNVDDSRDTPTQYLFETFNKQHIKVNLYDPLVKRYNVPIMELKDSVKGSDCIIYMVNHDIFRKIDLDLVSNLMRTKRIYFGTFDPIWRKWAEYGFQINIFGIPSEKINLLKI